MLFEEYQIPHKYRVLLLSTLPTARAFQEYFLALDLQEMKVLWGYLTWKDSVSV